jgi:hypothetical protein
MSGVDLANFIDDRAILRTLERLKAELPVRHGAHPCWSGYFLTDKM